MFRILEIETFERPAMYDPSGFPKSLEKLTEPDRKKMRKISRYESVMRVLKPKQRFRFVSPDIARDFFRVSGLDYLPDISISAVVGENGMGKSSLIDLMVRLINNTVYALKIGLRKYEEYNLRYVGDIFASMLFETDNGQYKIIQKDNIVQFIEIENNLILWQFNFEDRNSDNWGLKFGQKKVDSSVLLKKAREMFSLLFYSISLNYSAYSNNVRELQSEYTEDDELESYEGPDTVVTDSRIWMHGIFHKNDSYQLPLVLTPYRSSGNINYNNEQDLSRDRLYRLALLDSSPLYQVLENKKPYSMVFDINRKFLCYPQFRINGVSVVSEGLHKEMEWLYNNYRDYYDAEGSVAGDKNIVENDRNISKDFSRELVNGWSGYLGINLFDQAKELNEISKGDGNRALSYFIYKTVKIVGTYRKFRQRWQYSVQSLYNSCVEGDRLDKEIYQKKLEGFFRDLMTDNSHITLKLRRTLSLLIFKHYSTDLKEVRLRDFDTIIKAELKDQNTTISKVTEYGKEPLAHIWQYEELMPSPALNADVRFIIDSAGSIKTSALSSGERQMINVLTAVIYHIYNLYSLFQEESEKSVADNEDVLRYPYVNVIFDEAELYFHPKYQTQIINAILTAINGLKVNDHIKGINMIFATHSPFILSDIPRGNVLCLQDGRADETSLGHTFCANVYDILANNFFMTKFVGDFAVKKVQEIMDRIESHNVADYSKDVLNKEIKYVGDDFIRMNLSSRLDMKNR